MKKTTAQQLPADCSWIVTVSDKGVTVSLSREAVESCRKAIRTFVMRVLPWLLAGLATGEMTGARVWLLQQSDAPATAPTEDVVPQP